MVERARERRQKATYNNLAHASVFGSLLFLPIFFPFPKSVPGEFGHILDKLIV